MTIKPVTYYEIRCDHDGCNERPDDEYSAYADEGFADEVVDEFGWGTDDNGHHWCPEHRPKCTEGHVRHDPDDRCHRCGQWPEDDDPDAEKATL